MDSSMPDDRQFQEYYQQYLKHIKLKGLQPKTIDAYSRAIRRVGNYCDCRFDTLTSDQLLDYFSQLVDSYSWSTVKLDLYGLKLFYTHVLKKTWEEIPLIKPKRVSKIPDILSVEQINQLFAATNIVSYKVYFFTVYSMGLRLSEGINLKVGDIDKYTMQVHIRDSKGNKDRLVTLPQNTLLTLRWFWKLHKHPDLIFPNRKRGLENAHLVETPLDRGGIQSAMKAVIKELGIKKKFHPIRYGIVLPPTCLKPG
jgi:site-specific recombinase XerD